MNRHSLTIENGFVATEIRIDPAQVYGSGSSGRPVINIQTYFEVRFPFKTADRGFEIREIACRVSPFDQAWFASTRPTRVELRVTPQRRELKNHQVPLEIVLDRERLAFLERQSNGGNVRLRLHLEVFANELVKVAQTNDEYPRPVWALVERHVMREGIQVEIPRATWIERVLPQTGYGKIHVIELPAVPIDSCAGMKKSFAALSEAVELQKKGFVDEAVGRCRVALEPFFKPVEKIETDGTKRQIPVLDPSWETKLGKVSYDWLNGCFVGLKRPTNRPHHDTGRMFEQLEAQLLITVTTALIAYAVNITSEAAETGGDAS